MAANHAPARADERLAASIGGDDCVDIIDALPDGVLIIDHTGRLLMANTRLAELFGYERSDLIGLPVEALIPERFRYAHEEYRTRYARAPRVRPMGEQQTLTGRHFTGSEIPVEVSLSPFRADHAIATVRDVRWRESAATERERLLSNLRTVCQLSGVEMWGFDEAGVITLAEGPERGGFGPHRDLIGRSAIDDVLVGFPATVDALRRATGGEQVEFVLRGRRQARLIALRPAAAEPPDGPRPVVGVSVDVTALESARRTVELQRDHLNAILAAVSDGLVVIDEAGHFVESNEPFRQLVGYTDDELSNGGLAWLPTVHHNLGALAADTAFDTEIFDKRGDAIPARVTVRIIHNSDETHRLVMVHDRREELKVAAELDQARLTMALIDDRERIAHDLNDRVIQRLFSIGMGLQAQMSESGDERLVQRLGKAVDELDESIRELRRAVFSQ